MIAECHAYVPAVAVYLQWVDPLGGRIRYI
jgi:hypothetical protein